MKPCLCWRLRGYVSVFLSLWHMSCWAGKAPLCFLPPTPTHPPTSLYLTARERNMLSFYALHSLLVLSSHCNTAVFQHTNNWDCGGSSPPHCAASHPGVTTCQGTVSLRPQLHFPPDFAMPARLINPRATETCCSTYIYICCHELSMDVPALIGASTDTQYVCVHI